MALTRYGVLKGRILNFKDVGTRFHHMQLHVRAGKDDYRVSVNVKSKLDHSSLEYHLESDFEHPLTERLHGLSEGYTDLARKPAGLALDYIRSNVLEPGRVRQLDFSAGDLEGTLTELLRALRHDDEGLIVAFGEPWGPEAHPDNVFGFMPALGLHNVHMNQGNDARYRDDNGVWQDGALFFRLRGHWQALFLKFQSQVWHTDDGKGHVLEDCMSPPLRMTGLRLIPGAPLEVMVKNLSEASVDLSGWALANGRKARHKLGGELGAQHTFTFALEAGFWDERGDTLTLLDANGSKVDGVAFTKRQLEAKKLSFERLY